MLNTIRTYLIIIFWPNLCVAVVFQLLEILQYACGLKYDFDVIVTKVFI